MASARPLALALTLAALGAGTASAIPVGGATVADRHAAERKTLSREAAVLDRRRAALQQQLDVRRAELLTAQARLDVARQSFDQAYAAVSDRLVQLYRDPPVSDATELVLGNPADIAARMQLEQLVNRNDALTMQRYQLALLRLRTARQDLADRKAALVSAIARLSVRRAVVGARLAALPGPVVTVRPGTPVPFYGPLLPGYTPPPAPKPTGRGLAPGIVAGRTLPGTLYVDPATGRPYLP